jgi:hypothetical protein
MTVTTVNFPGLADAPTWLVGIVTRYETWKAGTATSLGTNDWLLHVNGGMLITVLIAIFFRRTLASPWPLFVTILAEATNEYFDKLAFGTWRWEDTSRDIFFTLLWPVLLFAFLQTGIIRKS